VPHISTRASGGRPLKQRYQIEPRHRSARRDLVLDAEPMPAIRCTAPGDALALDLGALTALTRLELRGYATDGPQQHELRNMLSPGVTVLGSGYAVLRVHK